MRGVKLTLVLAGIALAGAGCSVNVHIGPPVPPRFSCDTIEDSSACWEAQDKCREFGGRPVNGEKMWFCESLDDEQLRQWLDWSEGPLPVRTPKPYVSRAEWQKICGSKPVLSDGYLGWECGS